MKKLFFGLTFLLFAFSKPAKAVTGTYIEPFPNSIYISTHTSVLVSSSAVTTYGAATSRFRIVYVGNIDNSTTVVYFRTDGVTTAIPTQGWYVPGGGSVSIESGNPINFQLFAGTAPVTIRIMEFDK